MGLVARAIGWGQPERRAVSGKELEKWLINGTGNGDVSSGVAVDQDSALSSTAVFQALRILSGSVAMVPLGVFERLDPGREIRRDHPVHRVLQNPNPEITAIEFRQMLTSFAASAGNGYAQIVFNGAGEVEGLWPIPPHRIKPARSPNGTLRYEVARTDGGRLFLPMEEVFHLRGFMRGGLLGVDAVAKMQEAVGLSIATEKFAGSFFGNGSFLSGWLKFPQRLSKDAKDNVRKSLDRRHTGLDKAHRIGFLEEGMDWVGSGAHPEQSQLIEQRRFSVEEVARATNVPPHLLHHLERATFNNIEHLGISFVVYSLGEWYARWEQMIDKRLLLESERRAGLYTKHNPTALLRGDHQSRANFYDTLNKLGAMSPNDIRELEDMNPIPNGDRYFVRRDTIPLDAVDELVDSLSAPARSADTEERDVIDLAEHRTAREHRAIDDRVALRSDFRGLFREAAESAVTKEVVAIRAALNKAFGGRDAARLRELVDEFYETHDEWVAKRFLSVLKSYGGRVAAEAARDVDADPPTVDDFMEEYAVVMGRRWVGSSAGQLRKIMGEANPKDVEAALEERLAGWEENRATKEANREVVEAGEATVAHVYAAAGVAALRWSARGESCPLCQRLDGKTVGVRDYFVTSGGTVEPEGGEAAPLTSKINVRHPPLHGGCDCAIVVG